jgi:adenylate cyclase
MYCYDKQSNSLTTKAVRGSNINSFTIPIDKGIIGHVFSSQNGVLVDSAYEDWRFDKSLDQKRRSTTHNIICVPIRVGNTCLGCLEVANKKAGNYNKYDYKLVASVANELAIGLSTHFIASLPKGIERIREDEGVTQMANDNLLSPLLRNVLKILSEILKCEK